MSLPSQIAVSSPAKLCEGDYSAVGNAASEEDLFDHYWRRAYDGKLYSKKGDSLEAVAEVQKKNFERMQREARAFADRIGEVVPEWQDPAHQKTLEAVRKAVQQYELDWKVGDPIGDISKALRQDPLFADIADKYAMTIATNCLHCPEQTLSADHTLLLLLQQHNKIPVSEELKKRLSNAREFAKFVKADEGRARETGRFVDYFPKLKGMAQPGLETEEKRLDAAIASIVAPKITPELRAKWAFVQKRENIPPDAIPIKWMQEQLASDPTASQLGQPFWDAMRKESGSLELTLARALGGEELEKLFTQKEQVKEGFRLLKVYTPDIP